MWILFTLCFAVAALCCAWAVFTICGWKSVEVDNVRYRVRRSWQHVRFILSDFQAEAEVDEEGNLFLTPEEEALVWKHSQESINRLRARWFLSCCATLEIQRIPGDYEGEGVLERQLVAVEPGEFGLAEEATLEATTKALGGFQIVRKVERKFYGGDELARFRGHKPKFHTEFQVIINDPEESSSHILNCRAVVFQPTMSPELIVVLMHADADCADGCFDLEMRLSDVAQTISFGSA